MPSAAFSPAKEDKFAFGIWCLQNRGRDPFGDQTRPERSAKHRIRGLAQRNCYCCEFHDNDVIAFAASAAQSEQIIQHMQNALANCVIKEPRGDLYLPTVCSVLAFIPTLDHTDMCGINPETAHIKMAGLNPYHEFAQAIDAGKLLDVHLNGQKPLRFDQDLSFGSDDLKEAFFTTKLLLDHDYQGTIGFDAHPYRSEADPWDFVDRNMRTFKIMKEKVRTLNENKEIQGLLQEIHGAN